jgi:hypothetical protein
MSRKINLVGAKFTKLKVISETDKISVWNCVCDCGNTIIASTRKLRSGHTKSCGCLQKEKIRLIGAKYKASKTLKSYDDFVVSLVNCHYRNAAKRNNRDFLLSKDDVKRLIYSPCHYCGVMGSNKYDDHQRKGIGNESAMYNGIDRVDNSKGYELDNCVPCCKICNRAKRELKYREFIEWLEQVKYFRNINNVNREL